MIIKIFKDENELAENASRVTAQAIRKAYEENGGIATILVATGASQMKFYEFLVKENVEWGKVRLFHLDEYVGISESHHASFRKYITERIINKVNPKEYYLLDTSKSIDEINNAVGHLLLSAPIDIGIIGIGENCHIAFNDPPADFEAEGPYIRVKLDEKCKMQQVREGWFDDINNVCSYAVTATCKTIMRCKKIISVVPFSVKAEAVKNMMLHDKNPLYPASILKEHKDWTLFLDSESSSLLEKTDKMCSAMQEL